MQRNTPKCGRHRVRRLMRKMRLVPIYQDPNTSKKHPQHKVWPYLLKNMVIERRPLKVMRGFNARPPIIHARKIKGL